MKFNKISRRLAAALMAGAMMVSMVGMTAFAAGTDTATTTLTKKITKDADVYAPSTTFKFTIEGVRELSGAVDEKGTAVTAPADGLVFRIDSETTSTTGIITSVPTEGKDGDIGKTSVTVETLAVEGNASVFSVPGKYLYKITEAETDADGTAYDGMEYDSAPRYVVVLVSNGTNGGLVIEDVRFTNADGTAKDDGVVDNKYGMGTTPDTDLYNLTLTKHVTGNQSVSTKKFTFTIKVDGAAGEKYYVVGGNNEPQTITSGSTVEVKLSNNESATIYGLSKDDTYTITEEDYSGANGGYTTYIANADGTGTLSPEQYKDVTPSRVATGTNSAADDRTVNVYNDKTVTTPTGVAMTIAPYILMVALAGVFAFLFLRRRNRAEY